MTNDLKPRSSGGLLNRRTFGSAAAGLAAYNLFPPAHRQARAQERFDGKTIRILTWTDATGQAAVRNIAKPFEAATGAKVIADLTGATSEMVAKIKASAAEPQFDIVILSGVGAIELANAGLLQKPDEGALPNMANVIPNMRTGASGFGVGYFLYCDGLLFNTKTFSSNVPTTYEVLWDEKYKGRLFLPPPQYTEAMELTVVAAKIAGGDERNPEPGFKLLEKLRDRVVLLADNQAQLADLFRTNSLDVGGVYSPMLMSDFISKPEYNLSGTLRLKEGFFYDLQFMIIPKGHPGDDAVIHAFINYALDPSVQSKMAEEVWYGPINQKATLSEKAKTSPYVVSGETVAKSGITLDKEYLSTVRQDWIQRYTEIFGT